MQRFLHMLSWGAALLPPAALLYIVNRFGILVPYWDHWDFVLILEKWQAGTLSLADLMRPHNAHRLLFPYLIMLGLAILTGWEVAYELLVNLVLGACIALLWAVLFWRAAAHDRIALRLWLPFAVSLATFSMLQWRNWLWGWQLQIFLMVAAVLLAVVLMFRPGGGWRSFCGSGAAAFVACYSFGAGIVLWPAMLVGILLEHERPNRWKRVVGWCILGAGTVGLFLLVAGVPRRAPSFPDPDYTELGYTLFFLGATGAGIGGFSGAVALGAGIVALPLFVMVAAPLLRDRQWSSVAAPFVTLALFGVGAAFLTMLGRGHDGLHGATESRYTSLTLPFWIALIALLAMGQRRQPSLWRLPVVLAIVLGIGLSSLHGARIGSLRDPMREEARAAILSGESELVLPHLFPDPALYENRRERLKALGMGPFRDTAARP